MDARYIVPIHNTKSVSLVIVTTKRNGKWRICIDYKKLNAATKRDYHPLPIQDIILEKVSGHEMYTFCDGYSGFYQIRIAENDVIKTTFTTPWGTFAFKVMPFGLTNAPATFQRFMQMVFAPYLGVFIEVFLDDFCIYSTRQKHLTKVRMAFHRIDEAKGSLNPKKCMIRATHGWLLGHIVSTDGICLDPEKVDAILKLSPPSTKRQVRSFVNLARYYWRFMDDLLPCCWKTTLIFAGMKSVTVGSYK